MIVHLVTFMPNVSASSQVTLPVSVIDDLKLSRGTVAQISIFVPQNNVIIVAYLLDQKVTHFDGIAEFEILKDRFIRSYINFLMDRAK